MRLRVIGLFVVVRIVAPEPTRALSALFPYCRSPFAKTTQAEHANEEVGSFSVCERRQLVFGRANTLAIKRSSRREGELRTKGRLRHCAEL